jgi:hypothetical protein
LHEKAEPSGSVFFCLVFQGYRVGFIAGKPSSHRFLWGVRDRCFTDVHCGSWLASDGGITVGASLEFDLTIQVQNWAKTSRIYILRTI